MKNWDFNRTQPKLDFRKKVGKSMIFSDNSPVVQHRTFNLTQLFEKHRTPKNISIDKVKATF